ncbi:MAG: nuclear transport factor 2 family protein [Hyphomonadaceae bacterium]|nr:nuclear transport factor 2 family protein [Hyphomonadaceae bacterium]
MRVWMMGLAALALTACETVPEFMQPVGAANAQAAPPTNIAPAATAPAGFTPPPDQQLLELERQLSAAAQAHGLGAALAEVIDPADGISIRSGVTYTAADVARGLAPPAGAGPIYWQPDRVHVSRSGDMGVTSGRYVQVVTGSEAVQGRYVIVWRRDSAGDWRVLTETRVADPARPAARRR